MMMTTNHQCLLWIILVTPGLCWNLTSFAPQDAPVGQVAVWRNKVFVSLPRYKPGILRATLIEMTWPEIQSSTKQTIRQPSSTLGTTSLAFPRVFPINGSRVQPEGQCPSLQNVSALDVDSMWGRLWILDTGTRVCYPKVIVVDLRKYEEILRVELSNMTSGVLSSIVADSALGPWGPRAYVGDSSSASLLVIESRGWWRIHLDVKNPEASVINTATLALSRREPLLYVTSPQSDLMFSLDLSSIRASPQPKKSQIRRQRVNYLGLKLGPSRGFVVDLWAGLHYFLPRDHASVRWDTRRPLSAESHTILLQSANILPNVSHMFVDPQWQVWAVVGQHCVRIQKYSFL